MNVPIISQLSRIKKWGQACIEPNRHALAMGIDALPQFVQASPVAMRYWRLLRPLNWRDFSERDLETRWARPASPYAPFTAACLVKLDQRFVSMPHLREYLVDHPALAWVLGFPLTRCTTTPHGFDVDQSLPTARHFTRMLRRMPNHCLQFLLDETVRLLQAELSTEIDDFGEVISLDTKHIIAWVKENNPKAYISDRYVKGNQPVGDPDCKLGCKRRRNQRASSDDPPPTPPDDPLPANTISVGEFYWGYASGVVATKVPDWGEFVLAELTQPFDQADVSYFHPLMAVTERRLGFKPRFGAFDGSFDAHYIYEYFHRDGHPIEFAFAAVPFSERGGKRRRQFDPDGLPLCEAGLPMPLKYTFINRTSFITHQRGRHVCPLMFPQQTAESCPVDHKNWDKGGCITTLPTSIGARIRYQLDRDGDLYKAVYKQRTATERINALAVDLGIERPRLRNGAAIANQNTLIYILLNLRALHRVQQKKAARTAS
jgi:hypothetical protein